MKNTIREILNSRISRGRSSTVRIQTFQVWDTISIMAARSIYADIAQLVVHPTCNREAMSSILIVGSILSSNSALTKAK